MNAAIMCLVPALLLFQGLQDMAGDMINSLGMRLKHIDAGRFTILPGYDQGHPVLISRPFYIGTTEVTQRQFQAVTGRNPSVFAGEEMPVDSVSWYEAMEFCRLLSEKEGQVYRLPTEAEWECAARAGGDGAYPWGPAFDPDNAWYADNSGSRPHLVGTRRPNTFGLYDLVGNVWEWCLDWYGEFPENDQIVTDPSGPESGEWKVIRGGSWQESPENLTLAQRGRSAPHAFSIVIGFRIVREIR